MKAFNPNLKVFLTDKMRVWAKTKKERGTLGWVRWRIAASLFHRRRPRWWGLAGLCSLLFSVPYRWYLNIRTKIFLRKGGPESRVNGRKCLLAVAVGSSGKHYVEKFVRRFKDRDFDFVFFVWDGTSFDEPIFKKCRIIHDKGIKWYFMKKYLTPEYCKSYDYIFPWDDDIELLEFSVDRFLDIMERNYLEVAQPALTRDSHHIHGMTLQRPGIVGRYTDFVEVMVQVFRKDAWVKFWNMLELDWNYWGWGYDDMANSLCGYKFTGIIDCEAVKHSKPCRRNKLANAECNRFVAKHRGAWRALKVSYAKLR